MHMFRYNSNHGVCFTVVLQVRGAATADTSRLFKGEQKYFVLELYCDIQADTLSNSPRPSLTTPTKNADTQHGGLYTTAVNN